MKSWASGLVTGVAISGAVFVAILLLWLVPKIKAQQEQFASVVAERNELQSKNQSLSALVEIGLRKNREQSAQLAALETPEATSPAYTLLYDPAPAGAAASPASQLLNLVRPGLGNVVASIAPQQPQGSPRWLVHGFVKPIVNGDSRGYFYSWYNAASGTVETHAAQGTVLTAPH